MKTQTSYTGQLVPPPSPSTPHPTAAPASPTPPPSPLKTKYEDPKKLHRSTCSAATPHHPTLQPLAPHLPLHPPHPKPNMKAQTSYTGQLVPPPSPSTPHPTAAPASPTPPPSPLKTKYEDPKKLHRTTCSTAIPHHPKQTDTNTDSQQTGRQAHNQTTRTGGRLKGRCTTDRQKQTCGRHAGKHTAGNADCRRAGRRQHRQVYRIHTMRGADSEGMCSHQTRMETGRHASMHAGRQACRHAGTGRQADKQAGYQRQANR